MWGDKSAAAPGELIWGANGAFIGIPVGAVCGAMAATIRGLSSRAKGRR
jgi:hypothetical protein